MPVLVWLHGGGWVLGNTRSYDPICTAIAHAAGVLVLSIDYRLAPEFRAPRAALDCVDAVRWVAGTAPALGARPDGIGVAATPPAPTCRPSSPRWCGPRGAPT